jgi:hypothetical protein
VLSGRGEGVSQSDEIVKISWRMQRISTVNDMSGADVTHASARVFVCVLFLSF